MTKLFLKNETWTCYCLLEILLHIAGNNTAEKLSVQIPFIYI